jgi:hypothetical protein
MHCTTSPPKSSEISKNVDLLAEFDRELTEIDWPKLGYGAAYLQMSTELWAAKYSPCEIRNVLFSVHFSRVEDQICWLLHSWAHKILAPAGQVNIDTIAGSLNLHVRTVRRTLKRLGYSRIILNLGTDRLQHFVINPLIEYWDLQVLRDLRRANTAKIKKRIKRL